MTGDSSEQALWDAVIEPEETSDQGEVFDVLYVEDDHASIRLLKEAFDETEPSVRLHGVQTGTAAITFLAGDGARASTVRPDVVLLDLNLGGMSGFDVLKRMQDQSPLGSIPVVLFTDSEAEADIEQAAEFGATAYVQKPSDFETLVAFAQRTVDSWHSDPTAVVAPQ